MFHDPDEQAPVPEQKNIKKESDVGFAIFGSIVVIAIFCWLGYWLLKFLAKLINVRNEPITVGMIIVALFVALSLFVIFKLHNIAEKKLDKMHSCSACLMMPLWGIVFVLLPYIVWNLVLWLMGILGFLPAYDVQSLMTFHW